MGSVVELASLSEAERQFSDRMSGSSLVGQFTIDVAGSRDEDVTGRVLEALDELGAG